MSDIPSPLSPFTRLNTMRTATALRQTICVIAGATLIGCGGDSGVTDPGIIKKDTTVTPTPPSKTAQINALLTEIINGQSAAGQSLSAGGVPGASAAPLSSAALTSLSPAALRSSAPDTANAALCVFDDATKRFNCPSRTQPNGLVTTMYFQLLDSAGTPQTDFDTLTTKGVRRVTDQKGVVSSPLITQSGPIPAVDTTNNHNDLVLSLGPLHKLNGTGLMSVVIVPEGRDVAHITAPTTTTNLQFPHDTTTHFPIAGQITATVTSITGTQPSVTTTQVTTYDGTSIAKLVITLPGGGKRTCTYDMTAPNVPATCTGP
jgi:hypothetical protein